MHSAARWSRWLRFLGGFLPRRIRERVFEPACYDLALQHLQGNRSMGLLGPRLLAVLLYVATANFPAVLVEKGRPSRLGFVVGSVLVLSLAALIGLRLALAEVYAAS